MKRISILALAFIGLGLYIRRFGMEPVVRAQGGCTAATLKGTYGLAVNGFFYDADGIQGVYASAGLAVADGLEGIIGADTVNLDGVPTRGRQFSGTYIINPNCSGSMSLKDSNGSAIANMDLVVTNGGKDVALVDYDTDRILNGTAKLQ